MDRRPRRDVEAQAGRGPRSLQQDPLHDRSFAAYNAGPGNFLRIRRATIASGLDPHLWFNNVELGAAKEIGRETVQYAASIFKYYVSFRLAEERDAAKTESKAAPVLDAPR